VNLNSGIYQGNVRHRRFSPKKHAFAYQLSMIGIELNELEKITQKHLIFGEKWFNPVRFHQKDYIKSEPGNLKERIANKVKALGGNWDANGDGNTVFMLVQCRCLGVYFSPINFYYCFDNNQHCQYLLAEVSNTPWHERHYYLLDITDKHKRNVCNKAFHVSPFMPLNMQYHWRVTAPKEKAFVHIENHVLADSGHDTHKVFDATMALKKRPMSSLKLLHTWVSLPFSIIKIVVLIYWQALKLFIKGVPFIPYEKQTNKKD
jgi:DUF1365 family protein